MNLTMKKLAIVVGVTLLSVQAYAGTVTSNQLQNDQQKLSYTIGYEMGKNFNTQSVNIDPKVMLQGMEDGLKGKTPALDDKDRKQAMITFQKEMLAKHEANVKALAVKNAKEGDMFLKENAAKPAVKTLPNGVQYKVLKESTGKKPTLKDSVTVNYSGQFIDGKVFDSSYKRGKPATFTLNQVIKGWQDALIHMPVGSTWEIYVPAKLAYGEQGMGNAIGPNQTLVFKIELISINDKQS